MAIEIQGGITIGNGITIGDVPLEAIFLITEDANFLITENSDNFVAE